MQPPQASARYRPDIDGLRAVAVLLVILFHSGFKSFRGGFVGVDVFFVISGFLITRLIYDQIAQGRFSFSRFYIRRVRRLFPALFFTLFFSFVCALVLFSPHQLERFGGALLHAVLSLSNFYFWGESGYFDMDAELKPLLHTWSLSVEEQFYFIWPLTLFLLLTKTPKWLPPLFIAGAGAASLYFAERWLSSDAAGAFFLAPFRVIEFAIGALMVWLIKRQPDNQIWLEPLVLIGLILIIVPATTYTSHMRFPGLNALLPCLGTALIIHAGTAEHFGKLLRNRLIVGLGLISYSLYLIHWPLIVFFNLNEPSGVGRFLVLPISILAATLMYFFIEKPFRRPAADGSGLSSRFFLTACALCAVMICAPATSAWISGGWGWRYASRTAEPDIFNYAKKQAARRFQVRMDMCRRKSKKGCDAIVEGRINALIVGDSHGADGLNAFYEIFPDHNFMLSTLGGCGPYSGMDKLLGAKFPNRAKCLILNEKRYQAAAYDKVDYVVISLLYAWYRPEHLEDYLIFLHKTGVKKVIIFGNYHVLKKPMPEIIFKHGRKPAFVSRQLANSFLFESQLEALAKKYGYSFVSKKNAFCADGKCQLFNRKSVPFTWDKHHLSYEFARTLGRRMSKTVKDYLKL